MLLPYVYSMNIDPAFFSFFPKCVCHVPGCAHSFSVITTVSACRLYLCVGEIQHQTTNNMHANQLDNRDIVSVHFNHGQTQAQTKKSFIQPHIIQS